jgi:hypothetical protein
MRNAIRKLTALAALAVAVGAATDVSGCGYAGVALAPDGTVYVARNGLFGLLRKVYSCKASAGTLTCTEAAEP